MADTMSYAPIETTAYIPTALGVEIIVSPKEIEAAPTLAVETPIRIFPFFPVSHLYQRERNEDATRVGLPTDHFEPFSARMPAGNTTGFTVSALGSIEAPTTPSKKPETPEERRQRLRNAPMIE